MNSSQPLHREDIKAALRKRNHTLASIARDLGVSSSMLSHLLAGMGVSARAEEALAEASGYSLEEVRAVTRVTRRSASHGSFDGSPKTAKSGRNRRSGSEPEVTP